MKKIEESLNHEIAKAVRANYHIAQKRSSILQHIYKAMILAILTTIIQLLFLFIPVVHSALQSV